MRLGLERRSTRLPLKGPGLVPSTLIVVQSSVTPVPGTSLPLLDIGMHPEERVFSEMTQRTVTTVIRRTQHAAMVCSARRTAGSCITETFSKMKHEAHFKYPV